MRHIYCCCAVHVARPDVDIRCFLPIQNRSFAAVSPAIQTRDNAAFCPCSECSCSICSRSRHRALCDAAKFPGPGVRSGQNGTNPNYPFAASCLNNHGLLHRSRATSLSLPRSHVLRLGPPTEEIGIHPVSSAGILIDKENLAVPMRYHRFQS